MDIFCLLCKASRTWGSLSLLVLVLGVAGTANATSIDLSPVDQKTVNETNDYYNIKVPNSSLKLSLSSSLTVAWDSNVGHSGSGGGGETSGWYVQPNLTLGISWPVTTFMKIHTSVGIGYRYYPDGSGEDDFLLNGDNGGLSTGIEAELRLGQNGKLTIGDNIRRQIDSIQMAASNMSNEMDGYSSTQNETFLQYQNDIRDDLHAIARYAHTVSWYEPADYNYMDFQSDMIDTLLLKDLTKGWSLGPYATASTTYYNNEDSATNQTRNDSTDVRFGLSFRRIGPVTLDGRAGYQLLDFDEKNGTTDNSTDGPTYNINAMFNTSDRLSHTLSHSYERTTEYRSININYAQQYTTTYQCVYAMTSRISWRGDVSWLNIEESDGGESADLLRFGIGPTYAFSKKTNLSLRYEYTKKLSDTETSEYDRTVLSMTLSHKF